VMSLRSAAMKRRTVSLTDSAVTALERLARRSGSNVSCVVEAAAVVIAEEGAGARAVEKRIVPDRRGGRRDGAGRKAARARRIDQRASKTGRFLEQVLPLNRSIERGECRAVLRLAAARGPWVQGQRDQTEAVDR
jgi:hypothetical protein